MRVNSAFTSFFIKRRAGSGIAAVVIAIFFINSSFIEHSDRDLRAKQVNLLIRQIGHRLLLQAGDSTSRVLPVTEIKEGTFLLEFENEFGFSHDSVMALSQRLFSRTQFPSGYTVTVHNCLKDGIVYGFQVNNTSSDILPCRGRMEPVGCYVIEFAFSDLYQNMEQKTADIGQPAKKIKSVKVDPQEASRQPEDFKTTTFEHNPSQLDEELVSINVDTQGANPKHEAFKTTTFASPLINLIYGGTLVLLAATLLIGRFWKVFTPVPVQNKNRALIINNVVPELTTLGKFSFDVKGQRLLLGSEVIGLTDKECKILQLFNNSFGELISRETLMQKVWISEGVITGRSLDMFVSKLRKKLSSDPELRITNVHGKGYKLEIPKMQI